MPGARPWGWWCWSTWKSRNPLSVSVVIPVCNSGATLSATIDSVLAQRHPPAEIIVVDDASSDNTREVLEAYGTRIRTILRERNSGSADIPRYQGVKAATGDWIALVDGDDLWDPDKLSAMISAAERRPDVPLWHHYVRVIDAGGKGTRVRHEGTIPPTGSIGGELLKRCFICTSAVFVKRDVWLAAQSEAQLGGYGTEWDFFIAIARDHPVGFVDHVLGSYRYTSGSISRKNWKRYSRDVVGMERIYRKGLWRGIVRRGQMKRIVVAAMHEDADLHRYDGHPGRSLWFCARALRFRPWDAGAWKRAGKAVVSMLVKR